MPGEPSDSKDFTDWARPERLWKEKTHETQERTDQVIWIERRLGLGYEESLENT